MRTSDIGHQTSGDRSPKPKVLGLVALLFFSTFAYCATDVAHDIVIYGSSPAAISAAVQAKRMGKRAVIVSPEKRIGGLTTGGLGQTDIGNKSAFGGIALEFYKDVAKWYSDPAHWTRQKSEQYKPEGQTAGTAGAMAAANGSAVQAVPYGDLAARLKADGQVFPFQSK